MRLTITHLTICVRMNINELKQADTKFAVEPLDFPGCQMAAVFDPDGNTVTIHRRKS